MKKIKLLSSVVGLGTVIAPIAMFGTSSCSSTSDLDLPSKNLTIKDGVLTGFDRNTDLSKYTKFTIPEGVKTIAKGAFKNVFTAGKYTYGVNNAVKTIKFPSSLQKIEADAFAGCTGIEKLDLSGMSPEQIINLEFESSNGSTIFQEWKAKGTTIFPEKLAGVQKDQIYTKLLQAGLPTLWILEGDDPKISESHILDINDFHGAAPGYGDDFFGKTKDKQHNPGAIRLAQETQEIINKYPGSVLLSAGDINAGDSFSTSTHGETLYPVLNAMDVRYSAIGNHGWEWGKDGLEKKIIDSSARTADTEGNYFINANVIAGKQWREYQWQQTDEDYDLWNTNRVKWADPYKVIDMNGHNVCLIGLTTHDTMTDGNITALEDTAIMDRGAYTTAIAFAKRLAKDELKNDYNKIESFILLTHCDSNQDQYKNISGEAQYIAQTIDDRSNIDAIISAHSHKIVCGTVHNMKIGGSQGKEIWVGQAGVSGQRFLDTKLVWDDNQDEGSRLKSISMEVHKPQIDGESMDKDVDPNYELANKQLQTIKETTFYPVVKNTIYEYNKQKEIAKSKLNTPIGTIAREGLAYRYMNDPKMGTSYLQTDTLLEPMGAWAQMSLALEFNDHYKDLIENKEIWPACVAFNNLDSFKAQFLPSGGTDIKTQAIFDLHPYENQVRYGVLTIDQLKQYINYFLDGGTDLFNYEYKYQYVTDTTSKTPVDFWYDDAHTEKVVFNSDEKVKPFGEPTGAEIPGVAPCCGCVQYYGLVFEVEVKRTAPDGMKIYKLKDNSKLKIYAPWDKTNNPNDPTTWMGEDDFKINSTTYGLVPVVSSSFLWQGGNAQNRMIHHFYEYNWEHLKTKYPQVECKLFDSLTRNCSLWYCEHLTKGVSPFASKPEALDYLVDFDFVKKLLIKPQA